MKQTNKKQTDSVRKSDPSNSVGCIKENLKNRKMLEIPFSELAGTLHDFT